MMHSLENNTFFIFFLLRGCKRTDGRDRMGLLQPPKGGNSKRTKKGAVLKVDTFREMLCCIRRIQGKSVGQGVVNYITDLGAFHCLKAVKQKS